MDFRLKVKAKAWLEEEQQGFNPCSNGLSAQRLLQCLVLLQGEGFNPCSNGLSAQRYL